MGKRILAIFLAVVFVCGCSLADKLCGKKEKKEIIKVKKLKNGHYQLSINNIPCVIRGVCYSPIPIGKSQLHNFMCDPNKPWIVDGKLMREMGINTVRLYQQGDEPAYCKAMIEELYKLYGIRTILGHSLGFWDYPPPNYADEEFRKYIEAEVLKTIEFFKDTPGLFMWVLGNENNYSFDGRVNPWSSAEIDAMKSFAEQRQARAKIYYSFVNEVAKKIKKVDPYHPIVLGNGEVIGLKEASEFCPGVDILGCIVYRGKNFGNLFKEVKRKFDKPMILIEFGCDAYDAAKQKEDQKIQSEFLKNQWLDIEKNLAGAAGEGNCLGGTIFEWNDEWWKSSECDRDSWLRHDTSATWGMGGYYFDAKAGKNMNEEWFGIVALSEELENKINKRIPRKAYFDLKELWLKESQKAKTK